MRKHFLILMLLALLPLAGWAADAEVGTAPAVTDDALTYSGSAQTIITAGTASVGTISFAVTTTNEAPAANADATWYALGSDNLKKTNAGTYYAWYKVVHSEDTGTDIAPTAIGSVTIAVKPLTNITTEISATAVTSTVYKGAVITPTVKVGGTTVTDGVNHYTVAWSSTIRNVGGYTVTVKHYADDNVTLNEQGTALLTVTAANLTVTALNNGITYGQDGLQVKDLYTTTGLLGDDATDATIMNNVVTVTYTGLTAQPTNAGVYPFTISAGTVANYNVAVNVANANYTISKKALTIDADDLASIIYGATTPTWASTFTGLLDADATDGQPKAGVLNGTLAYNVVGKEGTTIAGVSYWDAEGDVVGNAGTYTITPKIVDGEGTPLDAHTEANNYEVTFTTGEITIAQKNLSAVTVAPIPSQVYANADLTPVVSLKDGSKDLVEITDFTYAITYNNVDATPHDVKTYKVTFTGAGNYKGSVNKDFVVTPAPLTVLIKNQTKVYDGAEFDFGYTQSGEPLAIDNADDVLDAKAEIYGIQNNEDLGDVFTKLPILEYAAVNSSKVNVSNAYVISVKENTGESDNYDVVFEDGTLSITPMPIYLVADDKTQVYGKAAKTLTYSILDKNGTALVEGIETGEVDEPNVYMATAATLVKAEGTNYGPYDITFSAQGTATANYEIIDVTKGTYTIGKASLRIIAENKTKEYDGIAPVQSEGNAASTTNLTYKVVGLIDGDHITTAPTLSLVLADGEDGTDYKATGYVIKAEGAVVDNPDNYEAISYQNGIYTIEKKTLTVTAKKQGLLVGEMATALDNTLVEFDGLIESDKGKVTAVLGFSADVKLVAGAIDAIANQTEIDANGVIEDGIEVTAITGPKAGNYDVTAATAFVAGDLLITDATELITITPANKATWTAADEATRKSYGWQDIKSANNKKATVKFASFTMAPERWYTMVLPFKTNVAEISSKLGYAVVNVLNTSNTADEVKFKLHMQDIEANEPFLVKVYKEIDLANTDLDDDHLTLDPLTFEGKTIAYVETPSVADAKGTQFIGTFMGYIGTEGTTDEYYMATSNGKWYNAGIKGDDGKCGYTRPSGAYLKVAEGVHARILIEEPDGTTSIHTLTANGEMVPAQGWYTLNGVKLQGVPTEKGIYINNGKKVVIK